MIEELPTHRWRDLRQLVLKALADSRDSGCAAGDDNVAPHGLTYVDITRSNARLNKLVDTLLP